MLLLIVVGVGAYSIHGGLTSVMWADLFQCILLMVGGITLFFAALGKIPGGWSAMVAASPERMHLYQPPGHEMAPFLGMIIATFGAFTFYQVGNQAMIQRMLAARSTWDALMGLVFAQFINFLRPLVTCFLGLVVYHWIYVMQQHAPLEKPDLAFTFALGEFAPALGRARHRRGRSDRRGDGHAERPGELHLHHVLHRHLQEAHPQGGHRPRNGARGADRLLHRAAAGGGPLAGRRTVRHLQVLPVHADGHRHPLHGDDPDGHSLEARQLSRGAVRPGGRRGHHGVAVDDLQRPLRPTIPELHFFYIGGIAEVIIMIGIAIVALTTAPPDYAKIAPFVWRPQLLRDLRRRRAPAVVSTTEIVVRHRAVIWLYLYWRFW